MGHEAAQVSEKPIDKIHRNRSPRKYGLKDQCEDHEEDHVTPDLVGQYFIERSRGLFPRVIRRLQRDFVQQVLNVPEALYRFRALELSRKELVLASDGVDSGALLR